MELYDLYSLSDTMRVIRRRRRGAGHVAHIRKMRSSYRVFAGKPEEERPLGIPTRRWEDNIETNLRKMG